ncbi:MAG: CRISPR-associated endonuclease Cas2 [Ectobacillus sp.]
MARKKLLITYDVGIDHTSDQRRLRRVANICLQYGQRVQKSVFECSVTDVQKIKLVDSLIQEMDNEKDSIRIYTLHESTKEKIIHLGKNEPVDFEEPLLF